MRANSLFRSWLALLLFIAGLVCVCGCDQSTDADQVQVVTDAAYFKDFTSWPRAVQYGPYSLKLTTDSAIIAWEEHTWNDQLRHVEVDVHGLTPGTEYCYRVNGAEKDGRFLTAPDNGSDFSFFAWGDTRTGHEIAQQIAAQMLADQRPGRAR